MRVAKKLRAGVFCRNILSHDAVRVCICQMEPSTRNNARVRGFSIKVEQEANLACFTTTCVLLAYYVFCLLCSLLHHMVFVSAWSSKQLTKRAVPKRRVSQQSSMSLVTESWSISTAGTRSTITGLTPRHFTFTLLDGVRKMENHCHRQTVEIVFVIFRPSTSMAFWPYVMTCVRLRRWRSSSVPKWAARISRERLDQESQNFKVTSIPVGSTYTLDMTSLATSDRKLSVFEKRPTMPDWVVYLENGLT